MTEHEKRIREASNYALDNEWSYPVVENADLRALLADLDAVRVKAARYDWLRNQPVEVPAHGPDMTIRDGNGSGDALRGAAADEAIDAALKGASHE